MKFIRSLDSINYFVANKSLGKGVADKVSITFPVAQYANPNFTFNIKNSNLVVTAVADGSGKYTVNIPAIAEAGKYELYVKANGLNVGKLNVHVYEEKVKKVRIVPLANTTVTDAAITTALQQTLGEANITVELNRTALFTSPLYNDTTTFKVPDANLVTKYSAKMRDLRDYYLDTITNYDQDGYLIFVVNNLTDSAGLPTDGYMVRGRGLGFVSTTANANTFAHELAHGIGGLQHTWLNNGPAQGSTQNLMDYTSTGSANNLTKAQWKELRDIDLAASFWDEEEDGSSSSGLVAYYFWEEMSQTVISASNSNAPFHSNIKNNEVIKGFVTNETVTINPPSIFNASQQKKYIAGFFANRPSSVIFSKQTELKSQIYYRDHQGNWKIIVRAPVLYFELKPNGNNGYNKVFTTANENIILTTPNKQVNQKASAHYIVKKFLNSDGTFNHYQVFNAVGLDVTTQFLSNTKNAPNRYVVFSNGYRGSEWNQTDGKVTTTDRHAYWANIDDKFVSKNRLNVKKSNTFYIDGSCSIGTSAHRNTAMFVTSKAMQLNQYEHLDNVNVITTGYGTPYENTTYQPNGPKTPYLDFSFLNDTPNPEGFNVRKNAGRQAATIFLAKINEDPRSVDVKDTIDIVAHSMGYAYAMGFVDELKTKLHFGRFYIIAPEGASSGGNDWDLFEEVWQYGSNNNVSDENAAGAETVYGTRDPYWKQDGIAPQSPVLGIGTIYPNTKTGRAYVPKTEPMPASIGTFLGCHSIGNYGWIFELSELDKGYVKKR